jgi:hypothetical protein
VLEKIAADQAAMRSEIVNLTKERTHIGALFSEASAAYCDGSSTWLRNRRANFPLEPNPTRFRVGELTANDIDSLGSGRFLERYDDIGQYPLVWCETRFACIRPPREPHDASRRSALGVRLSRFDDVESILVKEERVVAETIAEIFNCGMIVRNRLSVELSQGSFDVLRRQFHPVLLSIASCASAHPSREARGLRRLTSRRL